VVARFTRMPNRTALGMCGLSNRTALDRRASLRADGAGVHRQRAAWLTTFPRQTGGNTPPFQCCWRGVIFAARESTLGLGKRCATSAQFKAPRLDMKLENRLVAPSSQRWPWRQHPDASTVSLIGDVAIHLG
jgi:hypothetical protein